MADELYDQFLNHPWKHCFSTHPAPHEAELECVIVEPRCHPRLGGVLRNMSAMLPYAAMTIICSQENVSFVRDIVATSPGNNVRILPHFEGNITRDQYSDFMQSQHLWEELLIADRILIFQTDSGVRKNNILRFMHFDYIGAPWSWIPDMPVGNGGFSLRNRRLMSHICSTYTQPQDSTRVEEDLFFSYCMKNFLGNQCNVPGSEDAGAFSVEYNYHEDPMGFHQAYGIHFERDAEYVRRLLTVPCSSPLGLPCIRDAWYQCTDGSKITHPRLIGYLRLGISHYGHKPDDCDIQPPWFIAASVPKGSHLVIKYDA